MRWRTVDIVTTAAIGVAFGVVFAASNVVWSIISAPGTIPPLYLMSGIWLMPAVLAPLIVRLPGAAVLAEVMAAAVSAFIGSTWGLDVLLSGLVQGAGAELVFALGLYQRWTLPMTLLAASGAAVGEWLHDMTVYYPTVDIGLQLAYGAFMLISAVLIAGLGSWSLVRLLRPTGVLAAFPSGRDAPEPTG
jgi:energy-coupling factor transport system substrate-specific component